MLAQHPQSQQIRWAYYHKINVLLFYIVCKQEYSPLPSQTTELCSEPDLSVAANMLTSCIPQTSSYLVLDEFNTEIRRSSCHYLTSSDYST